MKIKFSDRVTRQLRTAPEGGGGEGGTPSGGEGAGENGGQGGGTEGASSGSPNGGEGGNGGEPEGGGEPPKDDTDWKARSRQNEDGRKAESKRADKAEADLAAERERTKNILKAAGYDPDNETPESAAERLTGERDTATTRADKAEGELRTLKRRNTAHAAAAKAGADLEALEDSSKFEKGLAELADDATETDVADYATDFLEKNPRYKAATAPAPATTSPAGGGEGTADTPDSIDDRRAARRKRRELE